MNTVTENNVGGTIMNSTTNIYTDERLTAAEIATRFNTHIVTVNLALSDQSLHGINASGTWTVGLRCAGAWARGEKCGHMTRAEFEQERDAATVTPCKYPECTGHGHELIAPESDWSHEAVNASFDGGIVLSSISDHLGTFTGDISFEGSGEMTAAEFRVAADTYEAFPAWLRSMADRLDALA